MALFVAPDPANVPLIYVNANFPANLSKWALSAVVFSVNAYRFAFHSSWFVFDPRDSLKLIFITPLT